MSSRSRPCANKFHKSRFCCEQSAVYPWLCECGPRYGVCELLVPGWADVVAASVLSSMSTISCGELFGGRSGACRMFRINNKEWLTDSLSSLDKGCCEAGRKDQVSWGIYNEKQIEKEKCQYMLSNTFSKRRLRWSRTARVALGSRNASLALYRSWVNSWTICWEVGLWWVSTQTRHSTGTVRPTNNLITKNRNLSVTRSRKSSCLYYSSVITKRKPFTIKVTE